MCLETLILFLILLHIIVIVYCKLTCGLHKCSKHLVGKVVIVTGGSTGIGFETAKDLAYRGAKVIIACNDKDQETAVRDIISATGNLNVQFRYLDLGSFSSIRKFAKLFIETEKKLDILINNAGVIDSNHTITDDGFRLGMQVNYFGPFLLTNLLLPLLKSSAPSRIINVSSMAYRFGKLDFDDLTGTKKKQHTMKVYNNSKLCVVLMTVELGRALDGTGVTTNCLHPGFVRTTIGDHLGPPWLKHLLLFIQIGKTPWEGAQTSIYLAVSPDVDLVNGRYFSDCRQQNIATKANNPAITRKLWEASERLVILK